MLLPLVFMAQTPAVGPLSIGDTVPDILLSNIINHSNNSISLRDLKKPVILDFFATHCGGCIAALPHLDKLNQDREDALQVIVVSNESKEKVQNFLQRNPNVKNNRLPFVTGDTLLYRLFPHQSIPHEVWINAQGVVTAITRAEYVTEENVEKFINGKQLHLPLKSGIGIYDPANPLAALANENQVPFAFQSTLTGYINNAGQGIYGSVIMEDSAYRKFYFINSSFLSICRQLWQNAFMPNRFILHVRDSSGLINQKRNAANDWPLRNTFCYEIVVPAGTPVNRVREQVLSDFSRHLNLTASVKEVNMTCYILMFDSSAAKMNPVSDGGRPASKLFGKINEPKYLRNGLITRLITAMNSGTFGNGQSIIIDESGISRPVDLELGPVDVKNADDIKRALHPYGFTIVRGYRKLKMVVIEDLNNKTN